MQTPDRPLTEAGAFGELETLFHNPDYPRLEIPGSDVSVETIGGVEKADDCSITQIDLGKTAILMVQSTDFVRGAGFQLARYMGQEGVGWYLAGANLSDIAAMGAQPQNMKVVYRYQKGANEHDFSKFMRGVMGCCSVYGDGTKVVGGDTGSYDSWVAAADVTGFTSPDRLLTQDGARPGQLVCSTGSTGLAGAARLADKHGFITPDNCDAYPDSINKWRYVHPRIAEGLAITALQGTGGGTDTSDGLYAALKNIAQKSGAALRIDKQSIPIHDEVAKIARDTDIKGGALEVALGNSVDFELLTTLNPDNLDGINRLLGAKGMEPLVVIGEVYEPTSMEPGAYFTDGSLIRAAVEQHTA
jgi:thiamine-monophosphate kinase